MIRIPVFVLGIACAAGLCFAAEKKVPLKIELPQEVLAGTPPNVLAMLYPELELPPEKMPPILVPEGTTNLALKKQVTSSESDPILGAIAFVTDGKKAGSEDTYVELSPNLQWVQIDLGKKCHIAAIHIWHFFREARGYHDVIVQVSDDASFDTNVQTVYNNDTDASSKKGIGRDRPYIETYQGKLIDAKGVQGRYVRLYSNGNTANSLNHYVEVEVFGTPASAAEPQSK